jgi:predicted DsbA family dithiol-disulfide isomerase
MTPTITAPALTIDIVSDVVCPWCYIGKRKLEAALALPEATNLPPVHIRWHPFQLNPDLPAEGISRKQYIETKFGGPQRAKEIYARVSAAGSAVGLDLNFDGITQQANTLAAHALMAFAQQSPGNDEENSIGNRVKELLLKACFTEGRFIGNLDVLIEIALDAGLDGDAARVYLSDAANLSEVSKADTQARQMGISGVPFFIFNQKVAVSGAQDPGTLLAAMQQAVQASS